MTLTDALPLFETETLVAMSREAWLVSRQQANHGDTRRVALDAVQAIEAELAARNYPVL